MSHYFSIEQVHDRRQINLFIANIKLSYISNQFLKRLLSFKLSVQCIGSDFADLPFVGSILVTSLLPL